MPFHNCGFYNDLINLYLDVDNKFKENNMGKRMFEMVDTNPFFFELVSRSLQLKVQDNNFSGIGDLNKISINLLEDFNTPVVALAGQTILRARDFSYYEGSDATKISLEKRIHLDKEISEILVDLKKQESCCGLGYKGELFLQAIQEGAGLKLLKLYTDCTNNLLNNTYYQRIFVNKDLKPIRCALYRYFLYSGLIQVDKNQNIIKNSIPRFDTLSKLVDRFIDIHKLREEYTDSKIITEEFLLFNNVGLAKAH